MTVYMLKQESSSNCETCVRKPQLVELIILREASEFQSQFDMHVCLHNASNLHIHIYFIYKRRRALRIYICST